MTQRRSRRAMTRIDLVIWVTMVAVCSAMIVWSWIRFAPVSTGTGESDPSLEEREAATFSLAAPHIMLTDQNGRAFDSDSLRGKTWVVDFIFTNCAGPCPIMTANLRSLQAAVGPSDDIHFVSVTCDPWRDDAPTLKRYAESYQADLDQWTFATGDIAEIQKYAGQLLLTAENPRQAAEDRAQGDEDAAESGGGEKPGGDSESQTGLIIHSTRLALIDRAGIVHDWYIGTDPDDMERLLADVRALTVADTALPGVAWDLSVLPLVNALLNALAAVLLLFGRSLIRRGSRVAHQRVMIAAFLVSVAFLVCYIAYHWMRRQATGIAHTPWTVDGAIRWIYYFILVTHVMLAIAVPFLAVRTLYLATAGRFEAHRRLARVAWPIWMYVSVTGVIVYLMLNHLQPMLVTG